MTTALFSTIPLLMCMGYFFMGSLPLLILKHDTPMDSRFIRGFFSTYYVAVLCTASIPMISFALVGGFAFSAGMLVIALIALFLRKVLLAQMDDLRIRIESADSNAVTDFRHLHIAGMAINFLQLALLIWGLFHFFR
ncbi:hypothetical protein [Propionivibrio sp.]|uniref:hypothetical protein n=1 Tax=Propionivibrio sp. TaxID=2212460 RepID=UPI003BF34D44